MNINSIKDNETRIALQEIDRRLKELDSISQLPSNASTKEIVDTINKITKSIKRK